MRKRTALFALHVALIGLLWTACRVQNGPQAEAPRAQTESAETPRVETAGAQARRFPDARDARESSWEGRIFQLSQDYPAEQPPPEDYRRWEKYKLPSQWSEYLKAVLDYCYEGNLEAGWVVQNNRVRRWYHVPWLHYGRNGREYIHGLTHERVSEPGELAFTQTSRFQNWAVGMYNAPGGYVIGRVWRDPKHPDPSAADFPEGTVSVKLLFTQANEKEVPYLKGSEEWTAHIYRDIATPTNPLMPRTRQTLRLLQIDIAVRDKRYPIGWVFGTFVYNGNVKGATAWERMVPVGLMWGNDPGVTVAVVRGGTKLKETALNDSLDVPFQHLGWAGRLNGIVDNPISSCVSCHSTAQWPVPPKFSVVPPREVIPDSKEWEPWFRNLRADESFSGGESKSLSYSLQLAVGIQNFYEWQLLTMTMGGASAAQPSPTPAVGTVADGRPGVPPTQTRPPAVSISRAGIEDTAGP
jgi:hypothetical protein